MVGLLLIISLLSTVFSDAVWVSEFDYNLYLDDANSYRLYWTILNETHIEFGIEAKSRGWVGFGLSTNGQMPNSDIMFAWVNDIDGTTILQDRHAKTRSNPILDSQQNLVLIEGKQIDDYTSFRFIRSIIPCDTDNDLPIIDGTTRIIFAWNNDNDPDKNNFDSTVIWHGLNKGSKSVNILSGIYINDDINPLNTDYYDIIVSNYNVPSDDTTYYNTYHTLPATSIKEHIIKFEPLITVGNELNVHHIVVYKCGGANGKDCGAAAFGWAVGGNSWGFPVNVGLEMSTTSSGLQYIRLEIHYDNPLLLDNIIDSSGIRMYYTDILRTYDAGLLAIFVQLSTNHFIVNGLQNQTVNKAYCTSECTTTSLPSGGVKVVSSFLHAHVLGVALKLRHIRDGTELKPIDVNMGYDFDYQQTVSLPDEPIILPGDDLILECYYDTSKKDSVTYGGDSTSEEMCQVYMYVYPKPSLALCVSDFVSSDIKTWESGAKDANYLTGSSPNWIWNPLIAGSEAYYNELWSTTYQKRYIYCVDEGIGLLSGFGPYNFPNGFVEYVDSAICTNIANPISECCATPSILTTRLPTSSHPSIIPSKIPTNQPSNLPTYNPITPNPTQPPVAPGDPTTAPITPFPTNNPSQTPTNNPSESPTKQPSENPSIMPSMPPTLDPTLPCNLQSQYEMLLSDESISIVVSINVQLDDVEITITGPADKWFGIGFGQSTMNELYAIISYEDGINIEERQLAPFSKGVPIIQIISIVNDTIDGNTRILMLKRSRLGEIFNFPSYPNSINVLAGYGMIESEFNTASSMGGHTSNANATTLEFECITSPQTTDNPTTELPATTMLSSNPSNLPSTSTTNNIVSTHEPTEIEIITTETLIHETESQNFVERNNDNINGTNGIIIIISCSVFVVISFISIGVIVYLKKKNQSKQIEDNSTNVVLQMEQRAFSGDESDNTDDLIDGERENITYNGDTRK